MPRKYAETLDDKFNALIQEALREAARIECSSIEYRSQLLAWKEEIDVCIEALEDSERGK